MEIQTDICGNKIEVKPKITVIDTIFEYINSFSINIGRLFQNQTMIWNRLNKIEKRLDVLEKRIK